MKCNEVWTAPFLLQQILSLGDPILHNQAELIATTGRGGEGGAEKRKGENEARKGERKEGRKGKGSWNGDGDGDGMAVRKIIALFLLPLHASWQFGMASGHNEGKFGASALI